MPPQSPALVVTTSGLVNIGGDGELVWTRVYTSGGRKPEQEQEQPRSPPPPSPPTQTQRQRRSTRAPLNAASLAALLTNQPVILLLHGFPDTGELWDRLGPSLAASTGAAVIAPDLPGAGLSAEAVRAGASCPEAVSAYGVGSLARRMLALLSRLGVERAAGVVGHDFGAAIAWRMAMAAPGRVRRLAVLSVGHPAAIAAGGAKQRARFWYYLFLALSPPDEAERALARDNWALFRQVVGAGGGGGGGGGEGSAANAAAIDAYVARLSQSPLLLRAATNLYRANYRAENFGSTKVPPPVPGVTALGGAPASSSSSSLEAALGIISAKDAALTTEQMRASAQFVLPPAKWSCEVWPDSGHWMMREEPERLAGALSEFFAPACRSGGGKEDRLRRARL